MTILLFNRNISRLVAFFFHSMLSLMLLRIRLSTHCIAVAMMTEGSVHFHNLSSHHNEYQ